MEALFASGRIVDVILALVVLEALVLVAYHRVTGRGIAPADILFNLASGASLLLALRAALTGAPWTWIAVFLTASLASHLIDLGRRWPR